MDGLIPDRIQIRKVLERWENEGGRIIDDPAAGELKDVSKLPFGRGEQQRAAELSSFVPPSHRRWSKAGPVGNR